MFLDKLSTLFSQAYSRLGRMPGYTLLSMLGLVISLSGTVIITRYLHQEWTIDHWMPDLDRTYILCIQDTEGSHTDVVTPHLAYNINNASSYVSPTEGQSDVESFSDVRLYNSLFSVCLDENVTVDVPAVSVDSCFTNVYPLQAVEGTLVMRSEGQAIVSEDFAKRYFPDESVVGKALKMGRRSELHTIVGVFRKPSGKTSIRFDLANYVPSGKSLMSFTMIKLVKGADPVAYNERQPVIWDNYNLRYHFLLRPFGPELRRMLERYGQETMSMATLSPCSSSKYLWMLFGVGVLLFCVGIFNFLNLYAVMRHTRDHEMKVRRIFGASRWNIFSMLYMENLLISAPAMLGVWMVIELTTPHMKDWFSIEQITMPVFDTVLSLSIMFILPLIATIRIPSRPSPSPSLVGRGGVTTTLMRSKHYAPSLQGRAGGGSGGAGSAGSRSFLFLQYFISIFLITVSIYMLRQLHLMMGSDPGYRTEGLMHYVPCERADYTLRYDDNGKPYYDFSRKGEDAILQKLKECPYIENMADDPDLINRMPETEVNGQNVVFYFLDATLMDMFGMELVEGRMLNNTLDRPYASYNCMLNETALKQLGLKDWRTDTVQTGNRLWVSRAEDMKTNPPFHVVGIIKDFHPGRLSEPQPPMIILSASEKNKGNMHSLPDDMLLDIKPGSEKNAIKFLKNMTKEVLGKEDIEYQWLTDQKAELYREDRRAARIFTTFSLLAIAVTCLGVLGLMMFDVRRRYREIALRKVHGARFRDIALLLSRRYIIILGAAACVSIPISLIGLHKLITRYYTIHATIAWWIPLLSLLIVFLLSALTLWYQIWRATRIEPSVVMKVE